VDLSQLRSHRSSDAACYLEGVRILHSFIGTAILVGLFIIAFGVTPIDWWPVR
jgi:hypothetical protein